MNFKLTIEGDEQDLAKAARLMKMLSIGTMLSEEIDDNVDKEESSTNADKPDCQDTCGHGKGENSMTEKDLLIARAKELGLKFRSDIKEDTLLKRVEAAEKLIAEDDNSEESREVAKLREAEEEENDDEDNSGSDEETTEESEEAAEESESDEEGEEEEPQQVEKAKSNPFAKAKKNKNKKRDSSPFKKGKKKSGLFK